VKFIKDAVSSWQINPSSIGQPNKPGKLCMPVGLTAGPLDGGGYPQSYVIALGTQIGILQQLSTRNGGEVISADAY